MSLIARLMEAGTPGDLIEEVAMLLAEKRVAEKAIEQRRANDRERTARTRGNVTSRDNTGHDVTERDDAPLSRPPNDNNSNPPTHTPPDMTSRPRKAEQFPCPEGCDPVDWASLLQTRKANKKPMTASAYRGLVGKLEGWSRDGWPPGPILRNAAEKGWQTVFETDEMKAGNHGRPGISAQNDRGSVRGSRPNPALDMVLQAERELQAEAFGQNTGSDWSARLALPSH